MTKSHMFTGADGQPKIETQLEHHRETRNISAEPHGDGTLTITHYGTRYFHWWVGEVTPRRGYLTVRIYGKAGGEAVLRITKDEAIILQDAVKAAQLAVRVAEEANR